jgi:hypothetical protein
MSKFWEKIEPVERINHKLIFPAVLLLLVIIILELFVHPTNEWIILGIEIGDYLVVTVFLVDLIFLAHHARNTKYFFKHYWLDLLAVFPFSLAFRLVEGISAVFVISEETIAVGQAIFHEGLEAEKAVVKAERVAKVGKELTVGARVVRVFTKTRGFTRFHRHKKEHLRI